MRTSIKSFFKAIEKKNSMVSKTLYRNTLKIILKYSVILTISSSFRVAALCDSASAALRFAT